MTSPATFSSFPISISFCAIPCKQCLLQIHYCLHVVGERVLLPVVITLSLVACSARFLHDGNQSLFATRSFQTFFFSVNPKQFNAVLLDSSSPFHLWLLCHWWLRLFSLFSYLCRNCKFGYTVSWWSRDSSEMPRTKGWVRTCIECSSRCSEGSETRKICWAKAIRSCKKNYWKGTGHANYSRTNPEVLYLFSYLQITFLEATPLFAQNCTPLKVSVGRLSNVLAKWVLPSYAIHWERIRVVILKAWADSSYSFF